MGNTTLLNGYEVSGNTFTLTSADDNFWTDDYVQYLQDFNDRNIYVYAGDGDDVIGPGNFFNVQDGNLSPQENTANFYDFESPVTLHFFGEDGDDLLIFSDNGSSNLYGGDGLDHVIIDFSGFSLETFELTTQSDGIILTSDHQRIKSTIFISKDVETIDGGMGGGYLMSELMEDELIYYPENDFNNLRSQLLDDYDLDGLHDERSIYHMWSKEESWWIELSNRHGKNYNDDTSRMWDAVKAVETNSGFSVLVEGQQKKEGKYKVATANEKGVINGVTRWLNGNQMFREGYEELFAIDFNGNSEIGI